jgi:hypothetical protein
MTDTTIKKIDSQHSPKGEKGQKYLVSSTTTAMRLWNNEQPREEKEATARPYETVSYVIRLSFSTLPAILVFGVSGYFQAAQQYLPALVASTVFKEVDTLPRSEI